MVHFVYSKLSLVSCQRQFKQGVFERKSVNRKLKWSRSDTNIEKGFCIWNGNTLNGLNIVGMGLAIVLRVGSRNP